MLIKIYADKHWWLLTHSLQKQAASLPQMKPVHCNTFMTKNVVI